MPSTPAERTQQAKIAALTRSSQEPSGAAMTEKARSKFLASFYDKTDPALPAAERQRQAKAALRAHMRKIRRRQATVVSIASDTAPVVMAIRNAAEEAAESIRKVAAQAIADAIAEAADAEIAAASADAV